MLTSSLTVTAETLESPFNLAYLWLQLLKEEPYGVWYSHLRERYQAQHKENLPMEFCDKIAVMTHSDIDLFKHDNFCILSLRKASLVSDPILS